jgi:glucose-1-phosphate adenylyltransferase
MKVKAVILAGGEGTRLATLTAKRAKPAVPFAGKYRIIDFTLSNCVNSGIFDVLMLTQYRPHSLHDHIARGRPWDLDRSFTGGIQLLSPFKGRFDTDWYAGTADAVYQNLSFVRQGRPELVIILSGDHIYEMDYDLFIQYHRSQNAELTLATIEIPMEETSRFGVVLTDEDDRVTEFIEKSANAPSTLASMGVYVFNYDTLERMLKEDHLDPNSDKDFGKNIIPRMIAEGMRVYSYPYGGYWIDVGTIDSYWEAHMDLLATPPSLNLNDRTWVIHTRSEERPPVWIADGAIIKDSLLTDGTVIGEGAVVERSVLSPGVFVGPGAVVRDSILLTDAYVEAGAVVERAILDKIVVIGKGARVGAVLPEGGELGITCVGKATHVPPGYNVGHSAILGADLNEEYFAAFPDKIIPPGTAIGYKKSK